MSEGTSESPEADLSFFYANVLSQPESKPTSNSVSHVQCSLSPIMNVGLYVNRTDPDDFITEATWPAVQTWDA